MQVKFIDSVLRNLSKKRKRTAKAYIRRVYIVKYLPILIALVLPFNIIIKLFFGVAWWLGVTIFYDHREIKLFRPGVRIWFGVPGSGKTSIAAWLTKSSIAMGYKVLSNVEIQGAYKLDENDLGTYDMSFGGAGCHAIYDESTINGLDNRGYKDFAKTNKPLYFSIIRHMSNMMDVFSQGYDIDKRIRDRAGQNGLFYLQKIGLKGFVMYKRIKKILYIDKDSKQIIDGFEFRGLPRICFTMPVWKSFDTLDDTLCPKLQKEWKLW